jgi:hypothetical protein
MAFMLMLCESTAASITVFYVDYNANDVQPFAPRWYDIMLTDEAMVSRVVAQWMTNNVNWTNVDVVKMQDQDPSTPFLGYDGLPVMVKLSNPNAMQLNDIWLHDDRTVQAPSERATRHNDRGSSSSSSKGSNYGYSTRPPRPPLQYAPVHSLLTPRPLQTPQHWQAPLNTSLQRDSDENEYVPSLVPTMLSDLIRDTSSSLLTTHTTPLRILANYKHPQSLPPQQCTAPRIPPPYEPVHLAPLPLHTTSSSQFYLRVPPIDRSAYTRLDFEDIVSLSNRKPLHTQVPFHTLSVLIQLFQNCQICTRLLLFQWVLIVLTSLSTLSPNSTRRHHLYYHSPVLTILSPALCMPRPTKGPPTTRVTGRHGSWRDTPRPCQPPTPSVPTASTTRPTRSLRAPVRLNIMLFNANGLTLPRWLTIQATALQQGVHVIVLTETHLGITTPPYIVDHHPSHLFFSGPQKKGKTHHRGGVAIISLHEDYTEKKNKIMA